MHLALLLAAATVLPDAAAGCARLPADFSIHAIRDGAGAGASSEVRILAWHRMIDDRKRRVDSALVYATDAHGHFLYSNVSRNPDQESAGWKARGGIEERGIIGQHLYRSKPTASELDTFLKDTKWPFEPYPGFRFIDNEVCDWAPIFGRSAWHGYK
jgi:hypothetical protein